MPKSILRFANTLLLLVWMLPTGIQAQINKPSNDYREYEAFTLKNGMDVIVVSDKNAENAAVALSVGVGSFHNPESQQGLAHYLEHMIFQGSEKFPESYNIKSLIEENGGNFGAFTRNTSTTYLFDINTDQYEQLLAQFSDAIQAPLFSPESEDKEIAAVHAEWQGQYQTDPFIWSRVAAQTANPKHPLKLFTIGNKEALSDKPNSILREELIQFYQRYYSANLMKLVLIGKASLPELKILAEKHFGPTLNKQTVLPKIEKLSVTNNERGQHIYVNPKQSLNSLFIQLPLNISPNNWSNRTAEYLVELLGSKQDDALGAQLLSKNWIKSTPVVWFSANNESIFGQNITLVFDLTKTRNKDNVVAQTFNYIDKIRAEGVNQEYVEQLRASLKFKSDRIRPRSISQRAQTIALSMHSSDSQHVLERGYYLSELNSAEINQVLEEMTLQNVRLWHVRKNKRNTPFNLEYADGKYGVERISAKDLKKWQRPSLSFELPQIVQNDQQDSRQHPFDENYSKPTTVYETEGAKTMLMHSKHHQAGDGLLKVVFHNKKIRQNIDSFANAQVLNKLFIKRAETFIQYAASNLQTAITIGIEESGDQFIKLEGDTSHHQEIMNQLIQIFLEIDIERKVLNQVYNGVIYSYSPKAINQSRFIEQMTVYYKDMFRQPANLFSQKQTFKALKAVKTKTVEQVHKEILEHSFINILAIGNYDASGLTVMTQQLEKYFLTDNKAPKTNLTTTLPVAINNTYTVKKKTSKDGVGIVDSYIYPEKSDKKLVQIRLLNQLMGPIFFTEMRSTKKLGYIVDSVVNEVLGYPSILLVIESHNTDIGSLKQHIDLFKTDFYQSLQSYDEQTFIDLKNAEIDNLTKVADNLYDEAKPFVEDWTKNNLSFDSVQNQITAVRNTTKSDLVELFKEIFVEENHASFMVQLKGKNFKSTPFYKP